MNIPKAIQKLTQSFEKLPGVGPKTAQRLTFYLLHVPQADLDNFSSALKNLKTETVQCSTCFTIAETDPCDVCSGKSRDRSVICVVENPLDVLALEKGKKYNGLYHVLNGKIDPLNNIGPDEIFIAQLIERVKRSHSAEALRDKEGGSVREIILATNPTMEGEATAMYIAKKLREQSVINHLPAGRQGQPLTITRIGRGLPIGADLEYADEITLQRAMEGRQSY